MRLRFVTKLSFVLGAIGVVGVGVLSSACGSAQHPTRQICKDSCLKVDPRDQAECLAKCD